jgi:PST family polysaccharide transporter
VFSLVLQTLLATFLTTAGLWMVSKWRPVLRWDAHEIRGVMGFSGNLVGFNVFNYFIRNADNLLIGRFLGATDLGYYSMAYRLMLWPLQNISNVVGRVLFPVFSRLQADQSRLGGAYIRATTAITLITAPLMFGFFVLREPFIAVALGDRWLPVANVLVWLMPVGLLQSIGTSVGTLYLATGRTDVMFKWGIGAGLLVIPAFAIGLQWGVTGVAAAYAVASLLLFWPSLAIPFRLVGLKVGDVLLRLMPSIATAAVMALVVAALAAAWSANRDNQLPRLILLVGVGMVTYGGLSLFTQRIQLKDIIRAVFNR